MTAVITNPGRFVLAALGAGAWVVVGGMLMAATFGYRDMKIAFEVAGLPIPQGVAPLITHILVRLVLGASIVALFVIVAQVASPGKAVLVAAGLAWLLSTVLPYAVIAQWGLFPWSVAAKLWTWSAAELLIAGLIGRWLYGAAALGVG